MNELITAQEFFDLQQKEDATEGDLFSLVQERAELLEKASNWDDMGEYVRSILAEGHPDDFWTVLEKTVGELEAGYSDVSEHYREWLQERAEKQVRERRRRFDLWSAADQWNDHLKEMIQNPLWSRGRRARAEREHERVQKSLDEEWELIK